MPSATTPALKRQNHRIHPCNAQRKNELLNHLIAQYSGKSILVVTSKDPSRIELKTGDAVTITSDELLIQAADLKCDVLISYDLPEKAIIYMSRFARAKEYALILLTAEDQKNLYPIETLLGRTIVQETISGFEPDFGIAAEQKSKEEAKARRAEREEQNAKRDAQPKRGSKPRPDAKRSDFKRDERGSKDESRPPKKPFSGSRDAHSTDSRGKKDAKPRFVGKDESGKPIFEGKTRERNHYIDGTPRSDAEKAARTRYSNKPKFFDGKESAQKESTEGKKPYEKKPFDKDKKPYDGKKSFGDKKPYGDKKAYDKSAKPASASTKPAPSETAAPKRPPRRINVKSLKPAEKGE